MAAWELFLQRCFDGITNGAIYGSLALALVIIYRSTGLLNFAQGEMATFATYVALVLHTPQSPVLKGTGLASLLPGTPWPIWASILGAMAFAFAFGVVVERTVIRPLEGRSAIAVVSVSLGVFLTINALVEQWWRPIPRAFPSVFPNEPDDYLLVAGARLRWERLGIWLTLLAVLAVLYPIMRYSKIGLAFRAVSSNREMSALMGIRVSRTVMLGWGLAAAIGALSGSLVANSVLLEPNMMVRLLIYSFAAATLGGLDSPGGAILGGLLVGVAQTMIGGYVGFIGSEFSLVTALVVIMVVLLVRPTGLFGTRRVERV
ncbi:MAG: branched-chain amino acid ABC transporter permease [Acidimicrobiales bacterium]